MEKRKVCAGCENLEKDEVMNFPLYSCSVTEMVIPHGTDRIDGKCVTTFWRIPLSCPLPDDEVIKSLDKAPESDWITI